jgi:hypothetical protein
MLHCLTYLGQDTIVTHGKAQIDPKDVDYG